MTIRLASADDLPAVAVLFDLYRQFYQQAADLPAAEAFLKERFALKESIVLVAEEDGELAGFTQLYPVFSSVSLRRTWLLNDLYVLSTYRGRGVGTALLDAAKDLGRERGIKWLLLETAEDNRTAQSVYEKNGWIREVDRYYRYELD
jgi:ribosomal protein S18 acetylase RimI-like enzyme